VDAWWEKHQNLAVTAKELLVIAGEFDELGVGGKDERAQATSLGENLSQQRDRVIDSYQILFGGIEHKARKWQLRVITSGTASPPSSGA
jgi:hypothetical protein